MGITVGKFVVAVNVGLVEGAEVVGSNVGARVVVGDLVGVLEGAA